jgi:archaellum biogenesis ATPase FlaH
MGIKNRHLWIDIFKQSDNTYNNVEDQFLWESLTNPKFTGSIEQDKQVKQMLESLHERRALWEEKLKPIWVID